MRQNMDTAKADTHRLIDRGVSTCRQAGHLTEHTEVAALLGCIYVTLLLQTKLC